MSNWQRAKKVDHPLMGNIMRIMVQLQAKLSKAFKASSGD